MKKLLILLALTSCSTTKSMKTTLYEQGNVKKVYKNLDAMEQMVEFDYNSGLISVRQLMLYTMFIEKQRKLLQTNNDK